MNSAASGGNGQKGRVEGSFMRESTGEGRIGAIEECDQSPTWLVGKTKEERVLDEIQIGTVQAAVHRSAR